MSKARKILEAIRDSRNSRKEETQVFEEAVSPKEKQEFVDNFNTSEGRKSIEKALFQLYGHKLSVTIKFGRNGMEVESSDISGETRPKLFKSLKVVSVEGGDFISADEISVPLEYQYELLDGKKVNTKLTTLFVSVSGLVNNAINQLR